MKNRKLIWVIVLCGMLSINSYGQSFINGDLEGIITGISCLPDNWQNVPFDDTNCLASQSGNDTPDLTNLSGPMMSIGMNGNPFSGNTFVSGAMVRNNNPSSFTQEGIMQSVNNFTIGQIYSIRFHQTIAKNIGSLDKSGSWAVYIDTVLADITAPTYSNEPYNSNNLIWEERSITFTATATTHLIKFLPMDDDTNYTVSTTDTLGALYMGIDSISIGVVTGLYEINHSDSFKLFPNPAKDVLKIEMQHHFTGTIKITNTFGKEIYVRNTEKNLSYFSIDLSNFPSGFYFVSFSNEYGVVNKKFVKE
jgi:hypothetical protein